MLNLLNVSAILIAYLFGSISSAIVVCRLLGLPDPRTQGSKNPGATNVLRIGGKKAAIITLLGDLLKGLIPVAVVIWLHLPSLIIGVCALAAFLGHLFPIFFRFEGGKGVATALGCLIALSWPSAICWGLTWLVMAILFRFSSLASITASILAPVYIWFFTHNEIYTVVYAVMTLLLLIRHQENIRKLLRGEESKIGKK